MAFVFLPNQQKHPTPSLLFYTISGITEYKTLQVSPLCVQPLHQFESIDRVPQEALRVLRGCS